jgi:hypothetical protein
MEKRFAEKEDRVMSEEEEKEREDAKKPAGAAP